MKKHLPTWLRTLASTVATVYFFSNVVLAYTPEKNLWAERRRHIEKSSANQTGEQDNLLLASLPAASSPVAMFQSLPSASRVTSALSEELAKTLPLSVTAAHAKLFSSLQTTHGTIRKVWLPAKNAGDRVVVHIQDVHQNQDAQRHIGGAIESLLSSGQAGVVGLEGAFAPIDVKAYHDYKNREVIRLTADYLLKENLITGPVHTAMTTPAPLAPMVGVDDPVHYNANVEAYRQSAPKMDTYKKAWEAKKYKLAEEKKNVFSPALLSFDAKVETYHARGEGLAEYVEALAPVKGEGHAGLLAQAFEMEKALDFTKIELDRKSLIDVLVKSLTQDQINQLVQESTSYRVGQIRYAEFYTYLKDLCRGAHVDLANYPHMDAYIRYVLLSDRIDGEKLLTELSNLEKARFGALVKTENEKSLVTRSRAITLAGRLLSFELSPEEWADYVKINADESLGLDMASFEAFYKEAHARDESLTENLLKAMDDGHHKTAVLVTGGYHTDGVSERLTQAGVTVVTFTPRVETLDTESGSTYLSIFTQEKTPLEKLFAGEKLFMSQNPMSPATQKVTAPAVTAAVSALEESPEASKGLFSKLGGLAKSISGAVENGVATVIVWGQEAGQAVKVVVWRTPGGLSVKQTVAASLSVATIALAITAFVVPTFAAITTAGVALAGVLPGVSLLSDISASLVSLTTGQLGNTILATLGVPYMGFNLTSTAEITKYVFAATFLILMAGSVGRKFVVIAGGRTSNQNRSQSSSRPGLTLATQADLDRTEPAEPETGDNASPENERKPEVVGYSDSGLPLYSPPDILIRPRTSDYGYPLGNPLVLFFVASTILLTFPVPAYAAVSSASSLFSWNDVVFPALASISTLVAGVFVVSHNRDPLSQGKTDPEKDAKEFIKAMSSPADLLNAVTPVARPLTLFPGTDKQTNIVEDAPRFAENMSYYGYQRGDATYLRKFKAALKEEITKKTGRQNNLQIMNILNTLLGGVTARIPLAGDTAKPTIIEATVNNQAELNAIVRTATDIQRANELMGANGPGIRLALAPSAEVTSKMIQDALFGSRVNTTNYHIKETPSNGEPFSFDEYVAASKRTMDYFNVKPTNVNLQYINAPNIGGLTAEFLSKMGSDTDDLRKLLAESLLAWLKTGDRWFTIESFNTMFEAAILAAQSA